MTTLPDRTFLLQHPAHFLALGFGSGLAPKAPGTVGTLIALPLFGLLIWLPWGWQLGVIAVLFCLGIPICTITGRALGAADHPSIVWDEIVAMLLILVFCPFYWQSWLVAFLLFRYFDILKPYPIAWFDEKFKNGFGVMLDDLLAAGYSILLLKVLQWLSNRYF